MNSYYDYNKNNKETYKKLVMTYLKSRNLFNMGYVRYSIIRNQIRYITNIEDSNVLRYIFQSLYNSGAFESKRIFNRIHYRFNPYKKRDTKDIFIVEFK